VTEDLWTAGGKVVTVQFSPPGTGVGVTTTTLSHFGMRVSVRPPQSSDVVDVAALTPGGEQESGPESDVA
jgi:hypothetical protein